RPMAAWRARPLTARIGAVIEGADLSQRMSDDEIGALRAALLEHQVLFFEDQHLTPVQHRDFAARFGALHTHPLYPGVPEAPELLVLETHAATRPDNDVWHPDVTFIEPPPMASILYAKQLPPTGGDTLWSNMRAAFEALSAPMQGMLSGLEAVHDF